MTKINCADCITLKDFQLDEMRRLHVSKKQEEYGGSFKETLDICLQKRSETLRGFCFLRMEQPFGLILLKRPPSSPPWVLEDDVSIHAFKIDQRLQGLGLGHQSFKLAVQAAVMTWPEARRLVLAVDAENTAAINLYRKNGMQDSGPIYRNRLGKEHRMCKLLGT